MSIFPNPSPTPGNQPPAAPPAAPPSSAAPPQYAPPPYYPPAPVPPPESKSKMVPILSVAVLLLLGGIIYLYMQLDHVKKDLASNNTALQAQLDKLVEASNLTSRTNT